MKTEHQAPASEKAKRIVSKIKEKTSMTAYKLILIENKKPTIFDSKFGGVPYWDLSMEYPLDENGNKMKLLAQINFTTAHLEDERLPKEGILQFFLSAENDSYGMDWNDMDNPKNFRLIYHEKIKKSVTKKQLLALDIPITVNNEEECGPVFKEVAVKIEKTITSLGTADYRFDKIFAETVKELFGEDLRNQNFLTYLDDDDIEYVWTECNNSGHWILGYPYFTQNDPREYKKDNYYDTLLLQIDSDMRDSFDYVLWGDCGVGNFFINGEALKNKDFSKVMYTWDCC